MKEVTIKDGNIVEVLTEIFPPHKVDTHLYYGIAKGKDKGFISRPKYEEGSYRAFCLAYLTKGNYWDSAAWHSVAGADTLEGFIRSLHLKRFKIYVFNTGQELAAWLAE